LTQTNLFDPPEKAAAERSTNPTPRIVGTTNSAVASSGVVAEVWFCNRLACIWFGKSRSEHPGECERGSPAINPGWKAAVAGMAQADAAEDEAWKARADIAIDQLAKSGREFTAEDVRAGAGDPRRPNAFGARLQAASRSGVIVKVGYRASRRASLHAHPVALWRGA
jgi:hypothetical protein